MGLRPRARFARAWSSAIIYVKTLRADKAERDRYKPFYDRHQNHHFFIVMMVDSSRSLKLSFWAQTEKNLFHDKDRWKENRNEIRKGLPKPSLCS